MKRARRKERKAWHYYPCRDRVERQNALCNADITWHENKLTDRVPRLRVPTDLIKERKDWHNPMADFVANISSNFLQLITSFEWAERILNKQTSKQASNKTMWCVLSKSPFNLIDQLVLELGSLAVNCQMLKLAYSLVYVCQELNIVCPTLNSIFDSSVWLLQSQYRIEYVQPTAPGRQL